MLIDHILSCQTIYLALQGLPGPAQVAVWSKALPLTASCLSPLGFLFPAGACEKVASDLELGAGFFAGDSGFLH